MKPLTDEEVDAIWLPIMGGTIRDHNPMKVREYRAMVRAGMMKTAEMIDSFKVSRYAETLSDYIDDLQSAIRTAAGGQHG